MAIEERAVVALGRLLNNSSHPQHSAIAHLASAACRAAASLVYLSDIDDLRFDGAWPIDEYNNAVVDDGHVRWAAATALTSLDLCIAAAGRLAGFAHRPPRDEDSIRTFYRIENSGTPIDKRYLVTPPWRAWIDAVIVDPRYNTLLDIRNALIHADVIRTTYGTFGELHGHSLRYGYNIGPLSRPPTGAGSSTLNARTIIELCRDIAMTHAEAFVQVLESLPQ